jgi:PTH1 family peptidyl-tRNA hydrolase
MFRPFQQRNHGGPMDWLVVFLGNPGRKYENTRHNVGFRAGDIIARRCSVSIKKLKYHALCADALLGGSRALLMKPQTFMNLSGTAVREAASFYKIPPERILVVADDVSLPVGKLRIRGSGSAGGHNGLRHIIACIGSENFPRVKIGVGAPPHPDYEMADWVLGIPTGQEQKALEEAIERAADALETVISDGIDRAMNQYN